MQVRESRTRALLVTGLAALAISARPTRAQQEKIAAAKEAVTEFLAAPALSESVLEKVVEPVLEAGRPAFAHVGGLIRAAEDDRARIARLEALGTHLTVRFVQRESERDLFYAGQYDTLKELQPLSGRLLLRLLLDTPDWFPDTHRSVLVPALRDVFPDSPGDDAMRGMVAIVENVEFEPENLRRLLSYALHQWGETKFVQPEIDRWLEQIGKGDGEDALHARQQLAEVYYQLRDYRKSAAVHREFLGGAESSGFRLTPGDYYNAACTYNLSGNPDEALTALERCAELQASDRVDSSLKLDRELFENDPEIAVLRSTDRFKKLMQKAFGGKDG